jgi:hypothetical protein
LTEARSQKEKLVQLKARRKKNKKNKPKRAAPSSTHSQKKIQRELNSDSWDSLKQENDPWIVATLVLDWLEHLKVDQLTFSLFFSLFFLLRESSQLEMDRNLQCH